MLCLNAVIIAVVLALHREFQAISFDEEYATVVGLPAERLYLILLCLVALTVVVLIQVVGVILIIALLTIPAAMSRRFSHRLSSMMFLSVFISAFVTISGLFLSYAFNLPVGCHNCFGRRNCVYCCFGFIVRLARSKKPVICHRGDRMGHRV